MGNLPQNVALVYDRVNKWGGAEQVLLNLHHLFPSAPLYTSVYNSQTAPWSKVFPQVIPSFLQHLPIARSQHELFPWATPISFETFDLNRFDAVISVTSADAKAIITKPKTFHLCYCLTPTRYLWSHHQEYKKQIDPTLEIITTPLFNYLKRWDKVASSRPDTYVAISQTVKNRITNYYQRDSIVVYPPVDIDVYSQPVPPPTLASDNFKDFFLYVSRLVPYKRPQLVVDVFNQLSHPLVVAGTGKLENQLRRLAKSNIHIAGFTTQDQLISFYQHCKALIYFHEEDFGIVPVEAQAAGKPVIGLNQGGVSETVIHGQTGILINDSSSQSLKQAILDFDSYSFDSESIKNHSKQFSPQRFKQEFAKVFIQQWNQYKSTYIV